MTFEQTMNQYMNLPVFGNSRGQAIRQAIEADMTPYVLGALSVGGEMVNATAIREHFVKVFEHHSREVRRPMGANL